MALQTVRLGKTGYSVSRISFGALPIQKLTAAASTQADSSSIYPS